MKGQSWKCSTKWSRAKITEFCPKNTLVIANTLFPTTHKVTLNMDITRWFTRNQIDYILRSQRWKTSIQSAKIRPAADYDSDHELLIAKFRLKLKKVWKTTMPFRYGLNQIPYNWFYSGGDKQNQGFRSDRKSVWRTMDGGLWHCTEGSGQDHPREKVIQKGKMVVWGGFTNSWGKKKRQRRKGKYTQLNAEFQRIAKRGKKAF